VDGLSIAPLHSPALASGPAGDRDAPRKFYATRHTFISLAMTKGMPLKLVTIYCGTSVEMIVQPLHVVAPWGINRETPSGSFPMGLRRRDVREEGLASVPKALSGISRLPGGAVPSATTDSGLKCPR
jgi:hypothetical protein